LQNPWATIDVHQKSLFNQRFGYSPSKKSTTINIGEFGGKDLFSDRRMAGLEILPDSPFTISQICFVKKVVQHFRPKLFCREKAVAKIKRTWENIISPDFVNPPTTTPLVPDLI